MVSKEAASDLALIFITQTTMQLDSLNILSYWPTWFTPSLTHSTACMYAYIYRPIGAGVCVCVQYQSVELIPQEHLLYYYWGQYHIKIIIIIIIIIIIVIKQYYLLCYMLNVMAHLYSAAISDTVNLVALRHGLCLMGLHSVTSHQHVLYLQGQSHTWQ